MAQTIEVASGTAAIKLRRPAAVAALCVVTVGVYFLFWYYKVNREMRDFGVGRGDGELADSRPANSAVAITIGGVIVVPALVSYVRTISRVQAVERLATGVARPGLGLRAAFVASELLALGSRAPHVGLQLWLAALAALVAAMSRTQARLNASWQANGASVEDPRISRPFRHDSCDSADAGVRENTMGG